MQKIICIGHAAYDITLPMEFYPIENTKMRIAPGVECGGGAAANAAYLLSKWGMDTSFIGMVGNDLYGSRIKEEFKAIGTNIDYLETSKDFHTSTSYILANLENGSRTIIVSRDKNQYVENRKFDFSPTGILVDGEEPEVSLHLLTQYPECISVIDAGNLKPGIIKLCPYVQYLVCSKDFAEEYTNEKIQVEDINTLLKVYQKIRNDFHNTVVITLGSDGSFTVIDEKPIVIPTLHIEKPVDSTAAGDIFHGAFTYFICNGYSLYDTVLLSNIAGALSVMELGGKNSMPELDQVLEWKDRIYHERS